MAVVNQVSFDESGNTGADLLNPDQPVFALASICLSHDQAQKLLAPLQTVQTQETKFSRLRRTSAGRKSIVELLKDQALPNYYPKISVVHKRFMVVTKIVDLLVETLAHEDGLDLYKDGANIAMSNLHFYCMPVFCGEGRTKTFLRRFVEMIRQRTSQSVKRFYTSARLIFENCQDQEYKSSLSPILLSERVVTTVLPNNNKNSVDPAIPTFFQHCAWWGEQLGAPFDTLHDESKPILQEKESLEMFMSQTEDATTIGYDRRKFQFPLRARSIAFGKSSRDSRLQVADVLAGSAAQWALGWLVDKDKRSPFWSEIESVNIAQFMRGAIWPTMDVSPQTLETEHSGGTNPVDAMAAYLHSKKLES
ncbi:MAG: DUF3800 domain-containing protein [Gammaproteobacteria bacterium]|nr:DUF3800 domain-containing protein [Gammaproteobacteria bacterium]MYE52079.1 DUF3800 domain-containing protein [Gammaproteobacteria bacterium]MYE87113.1 DUF3800 domain-containing protein [Gammaproteobacteria bacterium]MYF51060.1 DUF3800 domain-containing protein [Gammaproteobacteria bacterium]MYH16555.1 DUF3800 domain-containing protein [Gammaproteobacteria bacterium]